jgi:predicted PurR-regulated permease PerM
MNAKPRILLVDDEVAITENLAPFLERSGFEVTTRADGEQALKRLDEWKPDLIILDVLMPEERRWAERIGDNVLRATGGYVRGNLAISLVAGVASYIVLRILGVPYAETLAVLVAVLDIIPLVGATIGAIIVCIVGFATGGLVDGVVLVVYFVLYQQFENNVLQNVVYSKTVSLSPLIVFIAALIGAALGGIVGVLLAIPITSAAWVLAGDLIALRKARSDERGGRSPVVDAPPPDSLMGTEPERP